MLPLKADPRLFEYPSSDDRKDDEVSDQDTLRYELKISCTKNPQHPPESFLPEEMYRNSNGILSYTDLFIVYIIQKSFSNNN